MWPKTNLLTIAHGHACSGPLVVANRDRVAEKRVVRNCEVLVNPFEMKPYLVVWGMMRWQTVDRKIVGRHGPQRDRAGLHLAKLRVRLLHLSL